jgi:hypothetical protein
MRWTAFLIAVACTHTQPPPAPLGVPAENAAGPAGLADGGDGGSGDAGTDEDAGGPRAEVGRPALELDSADIREASRQALTTAPGHAN